MSKAHVKFVQAHAAHNAPGGGCIVYCTGSYEPGNAHSHRWHAANQARGESRVPYNTYDLVNPVPIFRPLARLQALQSQGGLAAPITPTANPNTHASMVQPFVTMEDPFPHNAHHIIPSSNLEECILKVVAKAAPNEGRMQDLVIGGLLSEPYNNNDQPNMIVLPTSLPDSQVLGLPVHTDGQPDHKPYRRTVERQIKGRFQSAYRSLAAAVAAEVHPKDQKVPTMGPTLVAISRQNYEAIIAVAMSRAAAGRSLDAVRRQVVRMASPSMGR